MDSRRSFKSSESAKKHVPAKKARASAKAAPVKKETADQIYQQRFDRFYDEMKWLYFELYPDNPYVQMHFDDLCAEMKKYYSDRPTALKNSEETCMAFNFTPRASAIVRYI